MPDEGGKAEMVSYLLGRVRELEAHILQLTERLRAQADKQKNYRRSKSTAARSNAVVTEAPSEQVRCSNDAVTPLPLPGNAAQSSPSHTLPLLSTSKRNIKYSSPLADFVGATWPQKPLTEELETAWRVACPGVDLLAEAKSARAWQLADLAKRTRPRALQFLGNWFNSAQQKIRAVPVRNGASLHVDNAQHQARPTGRRML